MSGQNKENISTIFIMPAVQILQDLKNVFYKYGFVNTYLFCPTCNYEFTPLYILFRPERFSPEFDIFISQLERNINFVETIDIKGGVVLVFKVPDKYLKDYELVLKGKYSKLSKNYKSLFPMKIWRNGLEEESMFFHIFNRTEILRDIYMEKYGVNENTLPYELYDICDQNREIIVINESSKKESTIINEISE